MLEPIIAKYAASPGPSPGNSWDKYGHAWHELYCFTALQVPSQDGWWYDDYHDMQSTTFIIPNFVCISPQKTFYIFSKLRKMFSIMFNSILVSYYEFWICQELWYIYFLVCLRSVCRRVESRISPLFPHLPSRASHDYLMRWILSNMTHASQPSKEFSQSQRIEGPYQGLSCMKRWNRLPALSLKTQC